MSLLPIISTAATVHLQVRRGTQVVFLEVRLQLIRFSDRAIWEIGQHLDFVLVNQREIGS